MQETISGHEGGFTNQGLPSEEALQEIREAWAKGAWLLDIGIWGRWVIDRGSNSRDRLPGGLEEN